MRPQGARQTWPDSIMPTESHLTFKVTVAIPTLACKHLLSLLPEKVKRDRVVRFELTQEVIVNLNLTKVKCIFLLVSPPTKLPIR